MLGRVRAFPTDMNLKRQFTSVDSADRHSASVGGSVSYLSVIPAIMQNSDMKDTSGSLGYSMKSEKDAYV